MGDFASVIGSGPIVGLDDIPADLSGYYRIVSDNVILDLADHSGDNIIDAHGNPYGVEIDLGSGMETVFGGAGDDTVDGGAGSDDVFGDAGDDELFGGRGLDTLDGGRGSDTLEGGRGDDALLGGRGDDALDGTSGDDTLMGQAGADELFGGRGDDLLDGGRGDDQMFGDAGDDTLIGGAGNDEMWGGAGSDTYLFESGFGDDVIGDFRGGTDQLWLTANLNGSGISNVRDVAKFVTGNDHQTTIKIGDDTIRLDGVGKDDFLSHLSTWVKVV